MKTEEIDPREQADKMREQAHQMVRTLFQVPDSEPAGFVEQFVDTVIGVAVLEVGATVAEAQKQAKAELPADKNGGLKIEVNPYPKGSPEYGKWLKANQVAEDRRTRGRKCQ